MLRMGFIILRDLPYKNYMKFLKRKYFFLNNILLIFKKKFSTYIYSVQRKDIKTSLQKMYSNC
jgi:hypothetical protein